MRIVKQRELHAHAFISLHLLPSLSQAPRFIFIWVNCKCDTGARAKCPGRPYPEQRPSAINEPLKAYPQLTCQETASAQTQGDFVKPSQVFPGRTKTCPGLQTDTLTRTRFRGATLPMRPESKPPVQYKACCLPLPISYDISTDSFNNRCLSLCIKQKFT